MNQTDLIEFIVYHIECTDCPCYVRCHHEQPRTCADMIRKLFQACDNVTNQAVKNLVEQIRSKYTAMIREKDAVRRRTLRAEWQELKRQLREVKDYIG